MYSIYTNPGSQYDSEQITVQNLQHRRGMKGGPCTVSRPKQYPLNTWAKSYTNRKLYNVDGHPVSSRQSGQIAIPTIIPR